METFELVDIFKTKGIEYLLVIVFLILFVVFARAVIFDRKERDRKTSEKTDADTR